MRQRRVRARSRSGTIRGRRGSRPARAWSRSPSAASRWAAARRAVGVRAPSPPPVYYLPPEDVRMEVLAPSDRHSWCEWKGLASYYHVVVPAAPGSAGGRAENGAWFYPHPTVPYKEIRGHVAFYPDVMEACFVDGERVQAQPGGFYGGWVNRERVGLF